MHKKIVPAVWFQNRLNPAPVSPAKPQVLELMESQLGAVVGGYIVAETLTYSDGHPCDNADG
jgi:hypothetical protein